MVLNDSQKAWAKTAYDKILEKERGVIRRSGQKIPYTTVNGIFDDKSTTDPAWWTNCFWHGILWLMYAETGDIDIRDLAGRLEQRMDPVLHTAENVNHDVGFMWLHASVANWRLTGNAASKNRGLIAANYLAARFNPDAGFITAWNGAERKGWSIIDTMMNLPLLYWAAEETGYERYRSIAGLHADKTMENVIRPDGSVVHIIEYSLADGSVIRTLGGQGYGVGSSWTRGQAWAIYGFALSHLHTGEKRYLDAAKRVAHYFLAACAMHGYIPPVDFRSPAEPRLIDTTAGAIAACGMLEIARALEGTHEAALYTDGALRLLQAIESTYADWSEKSDALVHMGSEGYHSATHKQHLDIIYGDYFFIEAFCKLCGQDKMLW